ncbi:MAG: hypothetical protein P1V36_15060, partial [Planctomycetota bacterium]|nr:hypothetical protein [Planctomycetota bacterium]
MTLDELIQQGWADHADKTAEVADRLEQGVGLVEEGPGAARYMNLVNHAVGDHLGERARATALCEAAIAQLGDDADGDAYLHLAVARRLSGDDKGPMAAQDASGGKEPSFGVRVGMLVAQGHMHAGAWGEADPLYRAMLATADLLEAGNAAERTVAVVSNNLASELLGVRERDARQDALMHDAAKAAFTYWSRVGTWVNQARGEYLLSLVQCSLGDPKSARDSAERG